MASVSVDDREPRTRNMVAINDDDNRNKYGKNKNIERTTISLVNDKNSSSQKAGDKEDRYDDEKIYGYR